MFYVLSPFAQEPCSSCSFVTRSLSMLFTFLGSNPFSAAVFRSAFPVLYSEYPANKTGTTVVFQNTMHHPLNPLVTVFLSFLSLSLVHLSGLNFYLSSLCSTFSNYLSLQLYYFSSYKDSIKIEFIKLNYIFYSGIGSIFYFSAL